MRSSQPGWAVSRGSCDTSSATVYGLEAGVTQTGPVEPGFQDQPGTHPIAGDKYFLSCGSWGSGEGAMSTITDLVPGERYAIKFFVAGFRPSSSLASRVYVEGSSYRAQVGSQGVELEFSPSGWIEQSFTFVADKPTDRFTLSATATDERGVVHFAVGANAISVVDTDQDGISDTQEIALGLNPETIDTDGDGLSDPDELFVYLTSATVADSDLDGLSDRDEVLIHSTWFFLKWTKMNRRR